MSAAVSPACAFVWNARNYIIPVTTLGIPLAIEAIVATVWTLQNPGCIKNRVIEVKQNLSQAFCRQPEESTPHYAKKLALNISRTAGAALALGASAAVPFVYMSPLMAIPAALAAIQLVGRTLLFLDRLPAMIGTAKDYIKGAFTKNPDEATEEYQKRRWEGIRCIVRYTLIFAGAVTLTAFAAQIARLLSQAQSVWNLETLLPNQTPTVVFCEYTLVAALHAVQAVLAMKNHSHGQAIFHACAAMAGIAFPIGYLAQGDQMRLHHSIIGLLVQLAPWSSVQTLGSIIAFDSFLNMTMDPRGYVDNYGIFRQYDYQNALVENMPWALISISSLTFLDDALDYFITTPAQQMALALSSAGQQKGGRQKLAPALSV